MKPKKKIVLVLATSALMLILFVAFMIFGGRSRDTYIIWDQHTSEFETLYVFQGNKMYARESVYPGYFEIRNFASENMPDHISDAAKKLFEYKRSERREFVYPGPRFARIHIKNNEPELFPFDDEDDDLRYAYSMLHNLVINEYYKTNALPEWIIADPTLNQWMQKYRVQRYMLGIDQPTTNTAPTAGTN